MGVLDPLKIAAMSLKAQKEEDHTRLKVELEEQFSKLLLSLKTNLLKKAQIANKKMDTMIKDQREYDDEVAVKTAMKNRISRYARRNESHLIPARFNVRLPEANDE